jgi:hypothetical protein
MSKSIALSALLCTVAASAQDAATLASRTVEDVLKNYYGNTLVCAAAITGNDLCHVWLNRDGTFINIDPTGGHAGHYRVGPLRADGKVPVCLYWDTPNLVMPREIGFPAPPRPSGVADRDVPVRPQPSLLCKTEGFRTTCTQVDPAALSTQDRKLAARTMGERFHEGMCYPLAPKRVGETWFEDDDPLPGQAGKDKLLLLPGRR